MGERIGDLVFGYFSWFGSDRRLNRSEFALRCFISCCILALGIWIFVKNKFHLADAVCSAGLFIDIVFFLTAVICSWLGRLHDINE